MSKVYLVVIRAMDKRSNVCVYNSEKEANDRASLMRSELNSLLLRKKEADDISFEDWDNRPYDTAFWSEAESIFGDIVHKVHLNDIHIKIEPVNFHSDN